MSSPDPRIVLGRWPGPLLEVLPTGATLAAFEATCGDGVRRNLVLARPAGTGPADDRDYLGSVVGRWANRIAGGHLELDGRTHALATHDRGNLLHGGPDGFDRRVWDVVAADDTSARLRLVSPDGDQGFPGRLVAEAAYSLLDDGFRMELTATTDAPTVVNLTLHGYATLDDSGGVDDHLLTVPADHYLPVDGTGIPTGDPQPVTGTRFDLRHGRRLADSGALDHTLVVTGEGLRPVAVLESTESRTRLTISSDQPGVQVYTGDALTTQAPRAGVALEPQRFPDAPHRWPASAVLRPGEVYRHVLTWQVS